MSMFIDLSGTARLPLPSEIRANAAAVLHCASLASESIHRAHTKWSFLAEAYAAPEQHQVHHALDLPRDAGEAVERGAARAASALEAFAAAVEGIRRRRMDLQAEADAFLAKENPLPGAASGLPADSVPLTLPAALLQNKADGLARDLAAAEDECISALARLERIPAGPESPRPLP